MKYATSVPAMPDPTEVQDQSRRFISVLRLLYRGVALLIGGTLVAGIVDPEALGAFFVPRRAGIELWQKLGVSLIMWAHLWIWFAILRTAVRLFEAIAHDDLAGVPPAATRLSRWLWGLVSWSVVGDLLGSVLVTWNAGPGNRMAAIGLSSIGFSAMLAAGLAAFLARAAALWAALWQDHREMI